MKIIPNVFHVGPEPKRNALITLRRVWRVLRPHKHSIYTRCLSCASWGINMPKDSRCGNCGSTETCEYYPTN